MRTYKFRIAVAVAMLLVVTVVRAQTGRSSSAAAADTFGGTSNKGLQPALDEAIQAAMKAHAGVADAMIEWELVKVSGRQGGIAGFNETTVTIRVTSGTPPRP